MYNEKLVPILNDIENKNIFLAGGSAVAIVLSTTVALIKYICNLTIDKKKYEQNQEEALKIKENAESLKLELLIAIDKDKEILEQLLKAYRIKEDNPFLYEKQCKEATEFCIKITQKALEVLNLVNQISKVGNKMLSSDFEICKIYAIASIKASIVNVKINLNSIHDEEYKKEKEKQYNKIYEKALELE